MWFKTPLILEEKVDGANLGAGAILLWTSLTGAGISIDENNKIRFQNRGHFVNATYQQQVRPRCPVFQRRARGKGGEALFGHIVSCSSHL